MAKIADLPGVEPAHISPELAKFTRSRLASAMRSLSLVEAELTVVDGNPAFASRLKYLNKRRKDFLLEITNLTAVLENTK